MFTPPGDGPRACAQCHRTMTHLRLRSHGGSAVTVDHCAACRLVWFDTLESVRLSGLGWVELLREFGRAESNPPTAARPPTLPCPACGRALKQVHNRTRWGRFAALECPLGHGHLHSVAGVLSERGLVRPLLPPERSALRAQQRELHCLGCGATADGTTDDCGWCGHPLLVVDLPRLGRALRQHGVDGETAPRADGVPLRWTCHACGTALDPTRSAACPQCGAGLLAPAIAPLRPLLDAAEHELRAVANHPARPGRAAPRPRTWRETQLARMLHWLRID